MRVVPAGIILLWLISTSFAGVIGKVDSVGFGSFVRRDTWTPMVVQVSSDAEMPEEYALQVVQYDLDGDEVVYTRPVIVNPGTQQFWTYFKPETIDGGIPVAQASTQADLAKRLRVFLATPDGEKRVVQVSVAGQMPQAVSYGSKGPGAKLIACLGRRPNVNDFDGGPDRVLGLNERLQFVQIDPRRLPDNVLGFEALDAVVWTDADPAALDPNQLRALRQYVQGGGRLVVLQNAEAGRMGKLDEFLPVAGVRVQEWSGLAPLKEMLVPPGVSVRDKNTGDAIDPFVKATGPFSMARGRPLPETLVAHWTAWPDGTQTPFIARHLLGMGSVTWVAQDLSDPALTTISYGWPRVWEQIFDWQIPSPRQIEFPDFMRRSDADRARQYWRDTGAQNIGASFINVDIGGKTAALVSIAFLFFIGYWLVAGPGLYVLLASRGKSQLSWYLYGGAAVVATLLTLGVAQLVLRGDPEIRHVTLVRAGGTPGTPARVVSRFGIYLPEDRPDARVQLAGARPGNATAITPLVIDPSFVQRDARMRDSSYQIPITSDDTLTTGAPGDNGAAVAIEAPFRSTLKKLEAQWTGDAPGMIGGQARVLDIRSNDDARLAGTLVNATGRDLSQVMIVFTYPRGRRFEDFVLYVRIWPKDGKLDLAESIVKAVKQARPTAEGETDASLDPNRFFSADLRFGRLGGAPRDWLHRDLRSGTISLGEAQLFDDSASSHRRSFPLASLYDRLATMQNDNQAYTDRVDLHRHGVRTWDVSGAISAGALVILAQTEASEIPLPLTVEGDTPEGTGVTFWQFILPLDRSAVNQPPATQPTEPQ